MQAAAADIESLAYVARSAWRRHGTGPSRDRHFPPSFIKDLFARDPADHDSSKQRVKKEPVRTLPVEPKGAAASKGATFGDIKSFIRSIVSKFTARRPSAWRNEDDDEVPLKKLETLPDRPSTSAGGFGAGRRRLDEPGVA